MSEKQWLTLVAPPERRPENGDRPPMIVGVPPPRENEEALDDVPFPILKDPPLEPSAPEDEPDEKDVLELETLPPPELLRPPPPPLRGYIRVKTLEELVKSKETGTIMSG